MVMVMVMVMVMAITLIALDDLHTAEIDEDFKVYDSDGNDDNSHVIDYDYDDNDNASCLCTSY